MLATYTSWTMKRYKGDKTPRKKDWGHKNSTGFKYDLSYLSDWAVRGEKVTVSYNKSSGSLGLKGSQGRLVNVLPSADWNLKI